GAPGSVGAYLVVHYCLTAVIMRLADGYGIDPTVSRTKIRKFMAMQAAKVRRKLDNGTRRLREADRFLKRPNSQYSYRPKDQPRAPVRQVPAKVITLQPAMIQ
ncbi:hypothetical protein K4749_05030, partial [Streptomyces sp. TRM72054]|uniref:hypothetical protein n=1 Tax=Streptomyces sp. TRM72054 TaxID=2870562 RepID=UPI001C8BBB8D